MKGNRETLDTDVGELLAEGRTAEARALETLAEVPLLDGVPLEALRRLAFEVRENVFPAGTEVVREGDEDGVGFFVVVGGAGAVYVGGRQVGLSRRATISARSRRSTAGRGRRRFVDDRAPLSDPRGRDLPRARPRSPRRGVEAARLPHGPRPSRR